MINYYIKNSVTLLLIGLLTACGKESPVNKQAVFTLSLHGSATTFYEKTNPAFNAGAIVENSMVSFQNQIFAFYDEGANGNFTSAELGNSGQNFFNQKILNLDRRFSYVLNYQETLYNFFYKANSIYLEKSTDGLNWQLINNGLPVLNSEPDPNSIYYNVWNVAVTVDEMGVWHLFVECADIRNNTYAGLAYSTAVMVGDQIDFNPNKSSTFLIQQAGNPYVTNVPGKGLLIVYGQIFLPNENFDYEWYVSAATFNLNTNTVTEHNEFQVGVRGIHVADPHLVELPNGKILLSLSVNQNSTYFAYSDQSMSEFYDLLLNGLY